MNPKDKSISSVALKTLAELGLIVETRNRKGRPLWRPSATGIQCYASRGLEPTFLHERSQYGYTHRRDQAMRGEPEVMDDDAVNRHNG